MRTMHFLCGIMLMTMSAPALQAQATGQQSLAGTLDIYVFPQQGQDAKQQSEDEASCYQWAVGQTGVDPFDAQKQMAAATQEGAAAQQQAAQAGAGSGARGAVGGAAVGALIGEIADDDAGKGAAWGAAAGLVSGRRHGRRHQAEAQEQAATQTEQAQHATQAQIDGFKKAFSACMEGKQYIAKF